MILVHGYGDFRMQFHRIQYKVTEIGIRSILRTLRDAWIMTGEPVSLAASMIAWSFSMLFTLKAAIPQPHAHRAVEQYVHMHSH